MGNFRWQLYPQNQEISQQIANKLNLHPVIAQILLNRKLRSITDVYNFLNPQKQISNNFSEKLLNTAGNIIHQAQKQQKKILIYGDYDVDGITSTTLLFSYLKQNNPNVSYYIPHRVKEGYGLNKKYIEKIITNRIDLLITLDNGISNFEEISYLKEKSHTEVIIMDHHTIPPQLPPADAILNPKMLEPNNPIYYLATIGIVYKFLEFFVEFEKSDYFLEKNLDLVALGTIADVAPLIQENRVLTKKGLQILNNRKRIAIEALLQANGFKKDYISPRDVSFIIAPMLNATGRLETADLGVELLLEKDESSAQKKAQKLKTLNTNRQKLGQSILNQVEQQLTEEELANKILILDGNSWHPGIIGITAAQLVRKYAKPAVLISTNHESGRGSARSFADINIFELLAEFRHLFSEFGGHKEAAGFGVKQENIADLKKSLIALANSQIKNEDLFPFLDIDFHLSATDINLNLAKALNDLAPFGSHNPQPLFYCDHLTPVDFRLVGNQEHLKVTFATKDNKILDGIGFNMADKLNLLYKKDIQVVFTLEISNWRGKNQVEINIVDLK